MCLLQVSRLNAIQGTDTQQGAKLRIIPHPAKYFRLFLLYFNVLDLPCTCGMGAIAGVKEADADCSLTGVCGEVTGCGNELPVFGRIG